MRLTLGFSLFLLLALSTNVHADPIVITDFRQITGAVFVDLPASNSLPPLPVDSVIITPDQSLVVGSFAGFAAGDPANPGSGDGYISCNCFGVPLTSVTLNFSSPVAAFGVTFTLFDPSRGFGNNFPALLQVFDGPNGTGNLLGSVMTVGWLGGINGNADFVAIWSDSLNIRSAVLTGIDPNTRGFFVDGYGLSQTPVPEPITLVLLSTGLAAIGVATRKRRLARGYLGKPD